MAEGRRNFGKYKPIAVLGRGGMATVYLATALGPGGFTKLVVIKELKPELADDPEFRSMFLDEARLAARLSHPNIVQTYEVGDEADQQFIVMEYLEGQPLNRVRRRLGAFGDAAVPAQVRVVADMLAGLHCAHELTDYDGTPLEVVHRDVSPHNVFITYAGEVKVVDFGIAKAIDSSAKTRTGVIKGKLSYMPPEQAFSTGLDRRADVFAAGVILWEVATGERMWKGMHEVGVLQRLSAGTVPRVHDVTADAPAELDRICSRALAVSVDERYATAADMQGDLEKYLAALPHAPSSREVGAMVAKAFADDRKEIRQLVDEQIRRARALPTNEYALPQIPSTMIPPSTPSVTQQSGTAEGNTRSSAILTQDVISKAPVTKGGLGVVLVLGTLGVLGIGVGGIALLRMQAPPPVASEDTPFGEPKANPSGGSSSVPRAVTGSPPAASARVTISVKPPKAKVSLDGAPIADNPHAQMIAIDGATHRVHAEAPGFLPFDEAITVDADRQLNVTLRRAPGPAGAGAAPAASGDPDLGF